jgi:hypothetical protein
LIEDAQNDAETGDDPKQEIDTEQAMADQGAEVGEAQVSA